MKQDPNTGRYTLRGYPHWSASPYDDSRTIKIKAAKNIISLITEWRNDGSDADGNKCGTEAMQSYEQAIQILNEEGEKYP